MKNMRVISDNAIDRSVLTASSEASASMSAANLKIDKKSSVWRSSNGPAARLNASWANAENIGCVALPFCNLSPSATMRVRLTKEAQATNLLLNTGAGVTGTSNDGAGGDTHTDNYGTSPDGTKTSVLISAGSRWRSVSSLAIGTTYTYSEFVRAGTASDIYLLNDGGGTSSSADFNLSSNTFVGNINVTGVSAYYVGSGWWRISMTFVATSTTGKFRYYPIGGSAEFWGAQLELGNVMTSYYPSGASSATRPLGYIDSWQSYAYDSGAAQCCSEPASQPRGWTAAQAASAYAYGGGAFARVWVPTQQAIGLAVDIVDTGNVQGYIEAARLVAGPYWSTTYNPSAVSFGIVDTTSMSRSDAGDQVCEAGKVHRTLSLSLSLMPPQDRAPFVSMLKNSRSYPLLVSVFPEINEEADTLIYGRRTKDSDVSIQYAFAYSSTLSLESI